MRNFLVFLTFTGVFTMASVCLAQADDESSNAAIEEILIVGEQPGPNLWKVYKGDNVLWVLGTFSPLPAKLEWRSQQAEDAIAQSQEVFLQPSAHASVGFFSQLSLLPSLIGIKKSPDGLSLQEKVPADVYDGWLILKEKYLGKNKSIEKYRPLFAGHELLEQAQKKVGFNNEDLVTKRVQELAKKHKVKVTTPTYEFAVEKPRETLKNFKQSELDDISCFTKMVDYLAADLDTMRLRANAWATGDLAALAGLSFTDHSSACFDAMMKSSFAEEEGMNDLPAKVEAEWFSKIDTALTNNKVSFALVPATEMLNKEKVVAKLQARGYRIEGFGFETVED